MPQALTRVNVTLPSDLLQELEAVVGPRKKSAFIAEAIEANLARLKKEMLLKELEAGYTATREEGLALCKEFEAADLEGWGEEY
jgi:metal-responsive CopG/Arc/MetJ family transcriptional regulator